MQSLLEDPDRTVINLVTLAEEMPVRETLDLQSQVETLLKIPKGFLLVNQVWPPMLQDVDLERLERLKDDDDKRLKGVLECMDLFTRRRALQEGYLSELRDKVDMPSVHVPYLFETEFGFQQIEQISAFLCEEANHIPPATVT